jgi:hypothetical protein
LQRALDEIGGHPGSKVNLVSSRRWLFWDYKPEDDETDVAPEPPEEDFDPEAPEDQEESYEEYESLEDDSSGVRESGLLYMDYDDLQQVDEPADDDERLLDDDDEMEVADRMPDGYVDSADYLRAELKETFDAQGATLDSLERNGDPRVSWDLTSDDVAPAVTKPSTHANVRPLSRHEAEGVIDGEQRSDWHPRETKPRKRRGRREREKLKSEARGGSSGEKKRDVQPRVNAAAAIEQLERLAALRKAGAITNSEFKLLKKQVFAGIHQES